MAAPGADLGQRRIGVDLDAPGLIVGEVPVEPVELVPGEDLQELLDLGGAVELARHVEMRRRASRAPAHQDFACGRKKKSLRVPARAAQDLPKGDEPVKQAGARGGEDIHALPAKRSPYPSGP